MKLYKIFLALFLFTGLSFAQTSTVTATITAPDGQVFKNGTVTASFLPPDGISNQSQYKLNGVSFPYNVTGSMNSSGVFTLTLTDESFVRPLGGRWQFVMCPTISTFCTVSVQDVIGGSVNLSTPLSAAIKPIQVNASLLPRAYIDAEILPGSFGGGVYYNYNNSAMEYYDGTTWHTLCTSDGFIAGCSGGGGGGNLNSSGSPAADYAAYWTDATHLTGTSSAKLKNTTAHTFVGNHNGVSGDAINTGIGTADYTPNIYAAGGGTAQAQTVTLPVAPDAYRNGLEIRWLPTANNTAAAPTINANALGTLTLVRFGNNPLVANDLSTSAVAFCVVLGTNCILQNPNTLYPINSNVTTYNIDGVLYTSLCTFLAGLPANSIITVNEQILETNITCNPFSAASGIVLQLNMAPQNQLYTFNVPITLIKTNDILNGWNRGRSGGNIYRGAAIAPSAGYASPFISTAPSGFTIGVTTTGCSSTIPAGTYKVGITWGPDTNRESGKDTWQEGTVTIADGAHCINVVHPGSPAAGVVKYNVYICHQDGCASGTELFQQQISIGSDFTLNSSSFASGTGSPPSINTTGAFVALASLSSASASAQNVLFGVRVQNISIDCTDVVGCVGGANFNAEEESGFFRVDFNNVPGTVDLYYGFYSIGLGASNSAIDEVEMNNGDTNSCASNPSIAAIYLDSIETFRGLNRFTITQQCPPVAIIASGSTLQPLSGTSITNGHIEKAATAGISLINFNGGIGNITASPNNVGTVVMTDINSHISVTGPIRGGSSDSPITSAYTGYTSGKSVETSYSDNLVTFITQYVGLPPTLDSIATTGFGTTPTFTVTSFSNNNWMRLNVTTGGGGEASSGALQLNFNTTNTLGTNNAFCVGNLWNSGAVPDQWDPRASLIGSSNGTGHNNFRWDNNGVTPADGVHLSFILTCGGV